MIAAQRLKDIYEIQKWKRVIAECDRQNILEVLQILSIYGFPSKRMVGRSNQALWMVIQHSSPEIMNHCLPMFRNAATQGELSWCNVAMMEDRVNVESGRPQKYGTQLVMVNGTLQPYKLEDPSMVDVWRALIGLEPLSKYIHTVRLVYGCK